MEKKREGGKGKVEEKWRVTERRCKDGVRGVIAGGKEGLNWCMLSCVCTQMGKLLAIRDKQSCSLTTASSDTYHYPGEFIMRH